MTVEKIQIKDGVAVCPGCGGTELTHAYSRDVYHFLEVRDGTIVATGPMESDSYDFRVFCNDCDWRDDNSDRYPLMCD